MLNTILNILSGKRFDIHNEKETQKQIEAALISQKILFKREHHLSLESIPDFFINGIAIEVKIKGNAREIFRQCERYCKFDEVTHLILITNRSMGFPPHINNKPCYIIKMGKQWL